MPIYGGNLSYKPFIAIIFTTMKKLILLSTLLSLTMLFFVISCKKDDIEPDTVQVFGITEKIGNIGYKELTEAYVKWLLVNPLDDNHPFLDEVGTQSQASKQPLSGFTLLPSNLGGKSTRTLTISASKPVYVSPLGTSGWYYANDKCYPDWQPKTGQSLKDFLYQELAASYDMTKGSTSVVLDGTELMTDKTKFREQTDVFDVLNIHKDFNTPDCDYSGQTAKVINDGYSMLLKLPKGKHTLVLKGTIPNDDPTLVFEAEVTWNLMVE